MAAAPLVANFLNNGEGAETPAIAQLPAELAQLIIAHQANLLDIVRASGEYLTSDDDKRRGRGISLLARVVTKCPKDSVTRQETRTLADFFISCISVPLSEQVFVPTLEGLTALAKLPHFGPLETTNLCKAIFKHVDLHGRPQTTRFLVYGLVDTLMAHHRQPLKRMGKEFLSGYCQLVTGEKDPRNLRLAFSIERVLLVEFDISESVEDLFDVIFCYFPITFTPPPNDPYGITSEQLQVSLRSCLAATPKFGPLALPLFLEKLQASATNAKRQTLEALVACFPVYGRAVVLESADVFWEAISVEIFHSTDSETEECALRALKALLATLFPDGDGEDLALPQDKSIKTLTKLREQCLLELKDADKASAAPAAKILSQAISASGVLAHHLVPKIFDHILELYKLPDKAQQRSALFQISTQLLEALQQASSPLAREAVLPYREELLSLSASNLASSATQEKALSCLAQLALVPDCLTRDEITFAIQSITEVLVKPSADAGEDIAASALDALRSLALAHPSYIEDITLPSLFQLLPDKAPSASESNVIAEYKVALAALSTLCTSPALFEPLLIRLLARVDALCTPKEIHTTQHHQTVIYIHHLLTTLRVVLERKIAAGHIDIQGCANRVLYRLFALCIGGTLRTDGAQTPTTSTKVLIDTGKVVTLLVQQMDERSQRAILADLNATFFHGRPQSLSVPEDAHVQTDFKPFSLQASIRHRNLCVLYAHAIYAMRPQVLDSASEVQQLCVTILDLVSGSSKDFRHEGLCQMLASLLNKKAEALSHVIEVSLPSFWKAKIADASVDLTERKAALTAWAWALRGLVMRSDSRAYEGISELLVLFSDEALNRDAARTMVVLSRENDGVISKANHAVIRLLYKQRFYAFIMPKLVQGYKASDNHGTAYLIGLSCLLQSMPKQTSVTELPKLLPLLLKALDLPELDLRATVVDTLALLVKDTPEAIKGHADSIVATLLRMASYDNSTVDSEAKANLRIAALKCLTVFPDSLDWLTLHQQKQPVLKALALAVDDPKKRVRKEAVDCRARWYLFKAP